MPGMVSNWPNWQKKRNLYFAKHGSPAQQELEVGQCSGSHLLVIHEPTYFFVDEIYFVL